MFNAFITSLQLFGIGFSFGIIGPCFLTCTPILITYIIGSKKRWREALADTLIFLSGRLLAYLILGILAGYSAAVLKDFTTSGLALFFKPLAGTISILFGISVIVHKADSHTCECGPAHNKAYSTGGLFALGFAIGITPCAPLLALLFEITLISKSALDGLYYGLSFGLGTALSGFIVVGALSGIVTWFPIKMLKSESGNFVFRIICGLLLMLFGLSLIL